MKTKILWFSNHRVTYEYSHDSELKKNSGRGWVAALEMVLRKYDEYELAIAFPDNSITEIKKNVFENRTFYQIPFPVNKLHRWFLRFRGRLEGPDYVEKYLTVIQDYKPDLIHIYGTENSFGEIISQVNIPVVFDLQGILSMIVRKWFSVISKFEVISYSSLYSLINFKSHYHDYQIKFKRSEREKRILANARYVMGRTQWDQMISKIMAPMATYYSCERIIKEAFWKYEWKRKEGAGLELISVMNEDFYKGLDVVFQSANQLKKAGYQFTWKVAGLKRNADYVRIISRKFHLDPADVNIEFLGRTDPVQLARLLAGANYYICTSYIENSPNSVSEAMVVGTPVITAHCGGVLSMLEHNRSGWTFQEGDFTMLSGLIIGLMETPDIILRVSSEGRRIARERHNPDRIVKKLTDNYAHILGKSDKST